MQAISLACVRFAETGLMFPHLPTRFAGGALQALQLRERSQPPGRAHDGQHAPHESGGRAGIGHRGPLTRLANAVEARDVVSALTVPAPVVHSKTRRKGESGGEACRRLLDAARAVDRSRRRSRRRRQRHGRADLFSARGAGGGLAPSGSPGRGVQITRTALATSASALRREAQTRRGAGRHHRHRQAEGRRRERRYDDVRSEPRRSPCCSPPRARLPEAS